MLRATLTLRCYAALRTAHAPSACLTQQPLDVLSGFYTYVYFTLFDVYYQVFTRLKFFTLFNGTCFILFCIHSQRFVKLNLE
ncbi:MAG: hypothetical protein NZ455_13915 [Bacteroidia bacterium]|nr:hypothetical protein [Bacteroidia bacterium]MDW8347258.1 hypothetical protein [Bacteroidia bacterium]